MANGASDKTKLDKKLDKMTREKNRIKKFIKSKGIETELTKQQIIEFLGKYYGRSSDDLELLKLVNMLETPVESSDILENLFVSKNL